MDQFALLVIVRIKLPFYLCVCIRPMCTNTHTVQDYAELLEGQLEPVDSERDSGSGEDMVLGRNFSSVELDLMSEQQLGQLLELKSETSKPRPNRTDDH